MGKLSWKILENHFSKIFQLYGVPFPNFATEKASHKDLSIHLKLGNYV